MVAMHNESGFIDSLDRLRVIRTRLRPQHAAQPLEQPAEAAAIGVWSSLGSLDRVLALSSSGGFRLTGSRNGA
jgi:hypothetical protein